MKALLMYPDRDLDPKQRPPWQATTLTQDLELDTLLNAMANNDSFLFDVALTALLSALHGNVQIIQHRQAILRDCINNAAVVRDLYGRLIDMFQTRRRSMFGIISRRPRGILYESIKLMELLLTTLRGLREIADLHAEGFTSGGFTSFFKMVENELGNDYLAVQHHLTALKFNKGLLLSADLGAGNAGTNYLLRKPSDDSPGWFKRLLGQGPPAYSFRLHPRDEAGARIVSNIYDCGVHSVANALAQSANHVFGFFEVLRAELAFYLGCLNLRDKLIAKQEPVCFPTPAPAGSHMHHFTGLYDPCLSLLIQQRAVGNTINANGKSLCVITGANRGGKSIFLRSVGLAQIMMQAGMFVAAESYQAELCEGIFTHYRREEDATMTRGKFDEELARMSDIVEHLAPNALLLCNESFAATNDREGSEIAGQVVRALQERGIEVFFVTHLYEFADKAIHGEHRNVLFLRANRDEDGQRSFKLTEGEPLDTSYGADLYTRIFST